MFLIYLLKLEEKMKDYKKEYILDVRDDEFSYVVTHNVYLAASLGSLGHEVY